jgi:hypothetical protein
VIVETGEEGLAVTRLIAPEPDESRQRALDEEQSSVDDLFAEGLY